MIAANLAFFAKIRRHEQRMSLFQDLSSKVIYLDEVLTMSARLAVSSGQEAWVKRYRDHEILLDQALHELLTEFPEIELSEETNEANQQLVVLGNQSIGLLKKGQREEAEMILSGEDYERFKAQYRISKARALEEMKSRFSKKRDSLIETCLELNALIFPLFSVTVTTWFMIVIKRRRNAEILKTDNAKPEKLLKEKGKQLMQISTLASIGEMSAGVAHEINNPSSVIYYCLELMEKSQGDSAKVTAQIEKLKRATRRLSRIAKGIERFAHVQKKKEMELVQLTQVVSETFEFLHPKVEKSRVQLRAQIPGDLQR